MNTENRDKGNKLPSFSLVLLCYNHEKYVEEALQSVFSQDYVGDIQYIIVDDASRDHTPEVVESYIKKFSDKDVTFIKHDKNQGVAAATDSAMSVSTKEWLILVDGDDIQYKDRCSKTAEIILRYPDICAVIGSSDNITADGHVFGQTGYASQWADSPEETLYVTKQERLGQGNPDNPRYKNFCMYAGLSAIRRTVYEKWGALMHPPTPSGRFLQDPAWELRIRLTGSVVGTRKLMAQYRSHGNNMLNRTYSKGVKGFKESELFHSVFAGSFMYSYERQLYDIERALNNPELTDCTPEEVKNLYARIEKRYNSYKMRYKWWELSFFGRLYRAISFSGKIDKTHTMWGWNRLLPLNITCFFRYAVQNVRRKLSRS